MGYILPIQPLESQHYQQRLIRTKQNSYEIKRIYNVLNIHEFKQHPNHHCQSFKQTLYTELTGKGKHINIRI